jgi:hypothetical protein
MGTSANWEFQTIPVDFEVWKALTTRLESPQDTYNAVLRRTLGLTVGRAAPESPASGAKAWVVDGVTFPHGTEFRARYKGVVHTGRVEDGALVVRGQRFESPSPAAIAITGNSVNGWKFWECRRPGQNAWTNIDGLRGK